MSTTSVSVFQTLAGEGACVPGGSFDWNAGSLACGRRFLRRDDAWYFSTRMSTTPVSVFQTLAGEGACDPGGSFDWNAGALACNAGSSGVTNSRYQST